MTDVGGCRCSGCVTTEVWVPIPGHPGYDASSFGRIRSWRPINGRGKWRARPYVLKRSRRSGTGRDNNHPGYLWVGLGRSKRYRVQYLVAEAFLGPRPAGQVVRHLNDKPSDNRPSNLAYGTHRDNYNDAVANGRRPPRIPHGTSNAYRGGCRCADCRTAKAAEKRRYAERKRAAA